MIYVGSRLHLHGFRVFLELQIKLQNVPLQVFFFFSRKQIPETLRNVISGTQYERLTYVL